MERLHFYGIYSFVGGTSGLKAQGLRTAKGIVLCINIIGLSRSERAKALHIWAFTLAGRNNYYATLPQGVALDYAIIELSARFYNHKTII